MNVSGDDLMPRNLKLDFFGVLTRCVFFDKLIQWYPKSRFTVDTGAVCDGDVRQTSSPIQKKKQSEKAQNLSFFRYLKRLVVKHW